MCSTVQKKPIGKRENFVEALWKYFKELTSCCSGVRLPIISISLSRIFAKPRDGVFKTFWEVFVASFASWRYIVSIEMGILENGDGSMEWQKIRFKNICHKSIGRNMSHFTWPNPIITLFNKRRWEKEESKIGKHRG